MTPQMHQALKELHDLVVKAPVELAEPPCAECGWQKTQHRGGGNAGTDHAFNPGPPAGVPFFTEAYLYSLLGKDDARNVLAAVRKVLRAAGLSEDELGDYV